MQKNKKTDEFLFSLIVATYGRYHELDNLLSSLCLQELSADYFEIIIVDQNNNGFLKAIVTKYEKTLLITHILSTKKGLSYNRNLGLSYARGNYICFPDDDCTYYPNTLVKVLKCFNETKSDAIFGAIRDRSTNKNIIRSWPDKNKILTKHNFFFLYSSITLFMKKNKLIFNEKLGVGCYFGSYEDADFVYRLIKTKKNCIYISDIELWHPNVGISDFTRKKNISYSLGFGAFCKINKFDIVVIKLFVMSLCYHFVFSVKHLVCLNKKSFSRSFDAFRYRLKGFWEY